MTHQTPAEIAKLAKTKLTTPYKEHCLVFSFSVRFDLLGIDIVSIGTLDANLVHPREVFLPAIRRHAGHILIVHNHPSGDVEPSDNDIEVTKRLVAAGRILGMDVLDHLIIGRRRFCSLRERGLL